MGMLDWIWIKFGELLGYELATAIFVAVAALLYVLRFAGKRFNILVSHTESMEDKQDSMVEHQKATDLSVHEVRDEIRGLRSDASTSQAAAAHAQSRISRRVGRLEGVVLGKDSLLQDPNGEEDE